MTNPLDDDAVARARLLNAQGVSAVVFARAFGYDPHETTDAIRGASFAHITDPPPRPDVSYRRRGTPGGRRLDGMRLATVRAVKLGLSQSEFAQVLQEAAHSLGYTDLRCDKRLVQKWESGENRLPIPAYVEALELATGVSIETLCTPIPPPDPGEAAQRLAKIIEGFAEIHKMLYDLHGHLSTQASPPPEPLVEDEVAEEIRGLRECGMNLDTIAAQLGVALATVRAVTADMPTPTYKDVSNAIANEARTRYRNDHTVTVAELAMQYGVRRGNLARAIQGKTHAISGTTPVYTLRPEPGITG